MNQRAVHLSFYRFLCLEDQPLLQEHKRVLRSECNNLGLLGTVLLAPEGINGMLSGTRSSIDSIRRFIMDRFEMGSRDFKEALVPESEAFHRMLVKVKREIIPIGDSSIRPSQETGKRLTATELKEWLDKGKEIILLDTRNDYEVEVGTFKGAQHFSLECSRDFLKKAAARKAELEAAPVVTFCTGGIRCEKASAALLKLGINEVYQLEGGILRYFEEVGSDHFEGNCFVFDWRLAVDGKLQPSARSVDPTKKFGRHQKK